VTTLPTPVLPAARSTLARRRAASITPLQRSAAPARPGQRGAALLTAMIIVSLIATLASGMMWQQWRAVQVEVAERSQSQAVWILKGALDWARLLLREDARNGGPDHHGEPWATPLAEARLSTFLAADRDNTDDAPDAFLSGAIRDAQARYNLRNVVVAGKVAPRELATLRRLCELVGQEPAVADRLAEALRLAQPGSSADLASTGNTEPPLMPERIDDIAWLGLPAAAVQALLPHLVLLPRATPINLNTASRTVLAAVIPGADLASAERLIQLRQRSPLQRREEAGPALGNTAQLDAARVGVSSSFFEVLGQLRADQLVVTQRSLVERNANLEVKVIFSQREPSDPARLRSP
jgi:general secretion pathway protein K